MTSRQEQIQEKGKSRKIRNIKIMKETKGYRNKRQGIDTKG